MPKPPPTLKDLVELGGEQARRVLIEEKKSFAPHWLLLNNKEQLIIVVTPWRDDKEKGLAEHALRLLIRKHKVVAYSVVVEAWMATKPVGWRPGGPDDVRPAKDPARKEVVLSIATDGRQQEIRSWFIQRDYFDRIHDLKPIRPEEDLMPGGILGWMTELLEK